MLFPDIMPLPYMLFLKKRQNLLLSSAAIIDGALRVKLTEKGL